MNSVKKKNKKKEKKNDIRWLIKLYIEKDWTKNTFSIIKIRNFSWY